MDKDTGRQLIELNNEFYRENGASFSRTRRVGWPGWDRACNSISKPDSVLDVACGNLRFKSFLESSFGAFRGSYYAVDSCPQLIPPGARCSFQRLDILQLLIDGGNLSQAITAPPSDLVVCFGFMHHIPLESMRNAVVDALIEKTSPGGHIVLSFWQFARNEKMATKAIATTKEGANVLGLRLDGNGNDYLLGWNDLPNVYRYCHSFTDIEIDEIAKSVKHRMSIEGRYRADGRTGELNSYLVLRHP